MTISEKITVGNYLITFYHRGYIDAGGTFTQQNFIKKLNLLNNKFIEFLGEAGASHKTESSNILYILGKNDGGKFPLITDLKFIVAKVRINIPVPSTFQNVISSIGTGVGVTAKQVGTAAADAASSTLSLAKYLPYIAIAGVGFYILFMTGAFRKQ